MKIFSKLMINLFVIECSNVKFNKTKPSIHKPIKNIQIDNKSDVDEIIVSEQNILSRKSNKIIDTELGLETLRINFDTKENNLDNLDLQITNDKNFEYDEKNKLIPDSELNIKKNSDVICELHKDKSLIKESVKSKNANKESVIDIQPKKNLLNEPISSTPKINLFLNKNSKSKCNDLCYETNNFDNSLNNCNVLCVKDMDCEKCWYFSIIIAMYMIFILLFIYLDNK